MEATTQRMGRLFPDVDLRQKGGKATLISGDRVGRQLRWG
jgi:hypothetical protein